ncbi:MAG: hypothetical protein K9L59_11085 [Desulfobacterales bacterium]|nr:hypothetical protein [Desulfobacterales bacterium]MCF8079549.1 hypothetical protein [Desulfobacterales bacterium]
MNNASHHFRVSILRAFVVFILLALAVAPLSSAALPLGMTCPATCCALCFPGAASTGHGGLSPASGPADFCHDSPDTTCCDLSRSTLPAPGDALFGAAIPFFGAGGAIIGPTHAPVALPDGALRNFFKDPPPPSSFPPLYLTQKALLR